MPRGPDLYDRPQIDGPEPGIDAVLAFWLVVGVIAGLVALIGVLF